MDRQQPSRHQREAAAFGAALIAPAPRYVPTTKLQLVLADTACILVVVAAAFVSATDQALTLETLAAPLLVPLAAATSTFVASAYACGLYDDRRLQSARTSLAPAGVSLTAAMIAASPEPLESEARPSWILAAAGGLVALLLVRVIRAAAAKRGLIGSRCIVVGSAQKALRVRDFAQRFPHTAITVLGSVNPSASWTPQEPVGDIPVLGTTASLEEIVRAHRASLVVFAAPLAREDVELLRSLRLLRYAGVKVLDFTGLHEELAREIPLEYLNDEWLFLASTANSRLHALYLKRAMDLAGASLLLIPASAIIGLAALAIRLTSKGPVIFRQERLGLAARPFFVLKLRTMHEDAEKRGAMWSTDNDPRITPVGRFLRKFRIDELPQLVNVLRGDMSLIGPRPERPMFTDKITANVPLFRERLMVRPGITGWAQVMAPYAASIEDSQKKLQFDLYYAKHMSAGLDLLIAAKTVKTMVCGRERRQGGMTAGSQLAGARATTQSTPRILAR